MLSVAISAWYVIFGVSFAAIFWQMGSELRLLDGQVQLSGAEAATFGRIFGTPWLSVLIGILLGIPAILAHKRNLKGHADYWAEFYATPVRERRGRRVWQREKIVSFVTMAITPLSAMAVAWTFKTAILPAVFGPGMLYFLVYPELKDIHEAARAKLLEAAENEAGGAPA
jgi:hypothetical protein